MLLFVPDEDADEAAVHEELLSTSAVDGLVLSDTSPRDPRIEFLADRNLPFVSFGRTRLETPHSWVDVDGASGTRAAVEHLIRHGHSRIAYLGLASERDFALHRRRGYGEGLAAAQIPVDPALDISVADEAAATTAVERLLAAGRPMTAIVAANDMLALAAIRGAQASGVTVGRDGFAVIGFDDTPTAAVVSPALTSVRQPLEEAARVLVRLLTDRIQGRGPEGVLLEPELVLRESA